MSSSLDALATDLALVVCALAQQVEDAGGLRKRELLTLAHLQGMKSRVVGDLQERVGVLPAQMSRVLHVLEQREPPLVRRQINPDDKRKINVSTTLEGTEALAAQLTEGSRTAREVLAELELDEAGLALLARVVRTLRDRLMRTCADVDTAKGLNGTEVPVHRADEQASVPLGVNAEPE